MGDLKLVSHYNTLQYIHHFRGTGEKEEEYVGDHMIRRRKWRMITEEDKEDKRIEQVEWKEVEGEE